eukprot:UN00013
MKANNKTNKKYPEVPQFTPSQQLWSFEISADSLASHPNAQQSDGYYNAESPDGNRHGDGEGSSATQSSGMRIADLLNHKLEAIESIYKSVYLYHQNNNNKNKNNNNNNNTEWVNPAHIAKYVNTTEGKTVLNQYFNIARRYFILQELLSRQEEYEKQQQQQQEQQIQPNTTDNINNNKTSDSDDDIPNLEDELIVPQHADEQKQDQSDGNSRFDIDIDEFNSLITINPDPQLYTFTTPSIDIDNNDDNIKQQDQQQQHQQTDDNHENDKKQKQLILKYLNNEFIKQKEQIETEYQTMIPITIQRGLTYYFHLLKTIRREQRDAARMRLLVGKQIANHPTIKTQIENSSFLMQTLAKAYITTTQSILGDPVQQGFYLTTQQFQCSHDADQTALSLFNSDVFTTVSTFPHIQRHTWGEQTITTIFVNNQQTIQSWNRNPFQLETQDLMFFGNGLYSSSQQTCKIRKVVF